MENRVSALSSKRPFEKASDCLPHGGRIKGLSAMTRARDNVQLGRSARLLQTRVELLALRQRHLRILIAVQDQEGRIVF